ncbi:hypothetical protein BCR43DRAFT_486086 [Syncephalastrum racemosum]|uniref:Uncharacterized protein n=1 Tax=Syncephalastrum racemosum TaxID=13706 RepID=A0A1X2HNH7_SYNRA|nr:hypothetical protein BCR43DRAFT_486086 [Syncephalastrum racemosum]
MITLPTFKHHKAKEENSPRQPSRLSNCHHRAPSPENCNREDSLPSSPAQLKVRTQNLTGYALRSRRSANVTPDMAQVNGSQEPPEPNGYHEQNNKSILHTKDRHTLSHPPSPRRDGLRPLPPPQKQPIKKRTTAVPASSSHEGVATINSTATAMQSIPATKAMGARGAAEAAEATEATAATATTANLQPAKKYQQGQSGKAS